MRIQTLLWLLKKLVGRWVQSTLSTLLELRRAPHRHSSRCAPNVHDARKANARMRRPYVSARPSAGIPDRPVPGTPIGACTDCDAVAAQLGQRLPALQAVIDDLGVGRPVGHELPLCHQPLVSAAATLRDFGCRNRRRWSALARVISSSILKQTWKCLNARSPTLLPRHETGGGGGIAAPRTLA